MNIQRLRNLTTGILHTEIVHIHEDLEWIIGEGLLTHMLPRAAKSIEPWLREKVTEERFWNEKFDTEHMGDFELPAPTEEDRKTFFELYKQMPNPLEGKQVIGLII